MLFRISVTEAPSAMSSMRMIDGVPDTRFLFQPALRWFRGHPSTDAGECSYAPKSPPDPESATGPGVIAGHRREPGRMPR
jgi:hypothetical protein